MRSWTRLMLGLLLTALVGTLLPLRAAAGEPGDDCNHNGVSDSQDLIPTASFATPTAYPVGARLDRVAIGDLDGDGLTDVVVAGWGSRTVVVVENTSRESSSDQNTNGVPDECEVAFHRGDASGDGALSLEDAFVILGYSLLGGARPECFSAADSNDDGRMDISDCVFILNHLFRGGVEIPTPGPPESPCGLDVSTPAGRPATDCASYESCES